MVNVHYTDDFNDKKILHFFQLNNFLNSQQRNVSHLKFLKEGDRHSMKGLKLSQMRFQTDENPAHFNDKEHLNITFGQTWNAMEARFIDLLDHRTYYAVTVSSRIK
ncbi:hypothetical protein AVEN_133569-1 [Araneus ventricosus]|uniref:Uncharacterized protein n=1 Tax=Araneus ventricosus TaxID=182803 RepID=A0A4Y2IA30_ARAVE|nr:hypothetical protein AVEN_133569-1 [Araneus ventricosus]